VTSKWERSRKIASRDLLRTTGIKDSLEQRFICVSTAYENFAIPASAPPSNSLAGAGVRKDRRNSWHFDEMHSLLCARGMYRILFRSVIQHELIARRCPDDPA
jgi:hypothetical protein